MITKLVCPKCRSRNFFPMPEGGFCIGLRISSTVEFVCGDCDSVFEPDKIGKLVYTRERFKMENFPFEHGFFRADRPSFIVSYEESTNAAADQCPYCGSVKEFDKSEPTEYPIPKMDSIDMPPHDKEIIEHFDRPREDYEDDAAYENRQDILRTLRAVSFLKSPKLNKWLRELGAAAGRQHREWVLNKIMEM